MAYTSDSLSPALTAASNGHIGTVSNSDLAQQAHKGVLSMHVVGAAAQAVRNIVLGTIPDVQSQSEDVMKNQAQLHQLWEVMANNLILAQKNADYWINSLQIDISSTIPNHIITYAGYYTEAVDPIIDALNQAKASGSNEQLKDAADLVQSLYDELNNKLSEIDSLTDKLNVYQANLQKDHERLLGGSNDIQRLLSIEQSEIDALQADIDQLHNEIATYQKQISMAAAGVGLGIFTACIGVVLLAVPGAQGAGVASIGVGVAGVAAGGAVWGTLQERVRQCEKNIAEDQSTRDMLKQQVIALTAFSCSLGHALGLVEQALSAMTDLRTFWKVCSDSMNSLLGHLKSARDGKSIIVDIVHLKATKENWASLSDFAEMLLASSENAQVEVRPAGT